MSVIRNLAVGEITGQILAHGLVLLAGNLDHQLAVASEQGRTCPEFVDILELIRGETMGVNLLKKLGYDDALSVPPFKVHWQSNTPAADGPDVTAMVVCPACSEAGGADRAVFHLPPICAPVVATEPLFGACPECGENPVRAPSSTRPRERTSRT